MRRKNCTMLILLLISMATMLTAQNYNPDDKAALRAFLRQTSADNQWNGVSLGLTEADTANWNSSEAWIAKLTGVTWTVNSPKRIRRVIWNGIYGRPGKLAGELNISACTEVFQLECGMNSLTKLIIGDQPDIKQIGCSDNQLTTLTIGTAPALTNLSCSNNRITALNVSGCPNLTQFVCSDNELKSLDISNNKELLNLFCSNNQLTNLNVGNNMAIQMIACNNNQLTELNGGNNTNLEWLTCFSNQLITLNVSKNTALEVLSCSDNQLKILNVSGNPALSSLSCTNNFLNFSTLPAPRTTYTSYQFRPQEEMEIKISEGVVDLSSQLSAIDKSGNSRTTVYTWKTVENGVTKALKRDSAYVEKDGIFTFLKSFDNGVYCEMFNLAFPNLNITTSNVKVTVKTSSVDFIPNASLKVFTTDRTLHIINEVQETVEIYSVNGVKLYSAQKKEGEFMVNMGDMIRGMIIVKGSSGWTKKLVIN